MRNRRLSKFTSSGNDKAYSTHVAIYDKAISTNRATQQSSYIDFLCIYTFLLIVYLLRLSVGLYASISIDIKLSLIYLLFYVAISIWLHVLIVCVTSLSAENDFIYLLIILELSIRLPV